MFGPIANAANTFLASAVGGIGTDYSLNTVMNAVFGSNNSSNIAQDLAGSLPIPGIDFISAATSFLQTLSGSFSAQTQANQRTTNNGGNNGGQPQSGLANDNNPNPTNCKW